MDRSVVGEGEEAFLAILERDGGDLAEAPGLPPAKPPG